MPLLKKIETDIGNCARLPCPHCLKESIFTLRRLETAFAPYGLPLFPLLKSYQLYCPQCKYRRDIAPEETSAAMRTVDLYTKLTTGAGGEKDFWQAVDKEGFRSLSKLREASRVWRCPNCHESVPFSLNECWQCKTKRPGNQTNEATESLHPPKLPADVTRPVHPWE